MRATGFVFISICLHLLCAAAVALTPTRTVTDSGETIEVQVGAPADKAGEAQAQESKADSTVKQVEPVKAEPVKPAPKAKPVAKQTTLPKKQAVVAVDQSTPTIEDAAAPAVAVKEEAAPAQEEEKVILTPVKETAPVGVEAAEDTKEEVAPIAAVVKEEPVVAAKPAAPAPIAAQENKSNSGQAQDKGTLVKGGATQEGAVSYLDLRQLPGNKSPNYPLQARVQKRQGHLELLYRVTKEGKVADMQIAKSSGYKDLDDEALRAIAQFKFVPGQEGWARHPVAFNLKGEMSPLPSRLRSKGGTQAVNE